MFSASVQAAPRVVEETADILYDGSGSDEWFNATDALWVPSDTPFDVTVFTNGTAKNISWCVQRSVVGIGLRYADTDEKPDKNLWCNGNSTFNGDSSNGTCKQWRTVTFDSQNSTFIGENSLTYRSGSGAWYRVYVISAAGNSNNATNASIRVYRQ